MAQKHNKPFEPLFVVEKRDANGQLDFSAPQPPFIEATENRLCEHYFANTDPNQYSASLETIYGWYNAQGFQIRRKTW